MLRNKLLDNFFKAVVSSNQPASNKAHIENELIKSFRKFHIQALAANLSLSFRIPTFPPVMFTMFTCSPAPHTRTPQVVIKLWDC